LVASVSLSEVFEKKPDKQVNPTTQALGDIWKAPKAAASPTQVRYYWCYHAPLV